MSGYEGWALVEVMGHRSHIGHVQPVEQYGTTMLRVEVPGDDGELTEGAPVHFYGGGSIFALTPMTHEQVKETLARRNAWRTPALEAGADDDVVGEFGDELEDLDADEFPPC